MKQLSRAALSMVIFLAPIGAASLSAQSPTGDIIRQDSLTAEKKALRDETTALRDTLDLLASIHARIVRAQASRMTAVTTSAGRQLPRACHAGAIGADRNARLIASMHTSAPAGDQALVQYHQALDTLAFNLRACQRDDSTLMALPAPDGQKIEALSAGAVNAIRRYELERDRLLKTLEISLPVRGKMFRG